MIWATKIRTVNSSKVRQQLLNKMQHNSNNRLLLRERLQLQWPSNYSLLPPTPSLRAVPSLTARRLRHLPAQKKTKRVKVNNCLRKPPKLQLCNNRWQWMSLPTISYLSPNLQTPTDSLWWIAQPPSQLLSTLSSWTRPYHMSSSAFAVSQRRWTWSRAMAAICGSMRIVLESTW